MKIKRPAAPFDRPRKVLIVCCALTLFVQGAHADSVATRHSQGWAHGFVEVTTMEGKRLAVGDLLQRVTKGQVTSRLVLNFFDGSVDDETTVYTQNRLMRLVTDHHVQKGPSFPEASDVLIDAVHGIVRTQDASGKVTEGHIDMPADTYNGMASTVLMNLPVDAKESTIAIVIGGAKPRIAHLKSTLGGKKPFTLGGASREAVEWTVHVDLGGVAKVIAPLIGKEPPDYHVLISGGDDPVFIREEGPLYQGGPIWLVQQVSAVVRE